MSFDAFVLSELAAEKRDMSEISVSIIIPHYNDLANLDVCLSRLMEQDCGPGVFEVIIADNNSSCGIGAVTELVGNRGRVILAREQGAGPARNAGVEVSRGGILAFIDSDCVPETGWVRNGLKAIAGADFIGGRVDVLPSSPEQLSATEAFETVFAFDFESYITRKNFTGSGNMFVRRDVFLAVGGFRKTVSEDMEWSHRAVARGHRLAYAADVAVGHPARRDWTELTAKWRRLVQESFAYHLQRGRSRFLWCVMAAAVFVSPPVHVVKILNSRKLSRWGDKAKAISMLFAIRGYRAFEMVRLAMTVPR